MAEYSANESLAEMHIHESLTNLARLASDVFRSFNEIVVNIRENTDFQRLYTKLRGLKDNVEDNRIMFMEYLVRLGDAVANRNLYIDLALKIDRSSQLLDGASYRLALYRTKGLNVDEELFGLLKEIAAALIAEYDSFCDGLSKLRVDPKKALQKVKSINDLEGRIDELYRHITFTLYSKYADNIVGLMVLKDAVDFMENTADTIKELGEDLRYLALQRALIA